MTLTASTDDCDECMKICKFGAINKVGEKIRINDDCIHCAQYIEVCRNYILSIQGIGFRVLMGGKEGSSVMFGNEYASFVEDYEVLEIIEKGLQNYVAKAGLRPGSSRKKERLGEVIARLGLEAFMN